MSTATKKQEHLRFSLIKVIEHWMNAISFIGLGMTGLVQKYIDSPVSELLIASMGGIESVRIIHRVCATALMLVTIMHLGTGSYSFFVLRKPLQIFPDKNDITNAWKSLKYNFGLEEHEPKQGFFTFEEKLEYWALVWGTLVMGISGFFLWNPITAAKFLPGAWIPVMKTAHSQEALLAVLAILIWHFYHVFIKYFNKSMYTGYISHEIMEHEHALVLEEEDPWQPPDKNDPAFERRQRTWGAIFGVFTVAMLAGTYLFVTVETTAVEEPAAIADLQNINSYSRLEPTPLPTLPMVEPANIGESWDTGVRDLFVDQCGTCHGPIGLADLTLTSYEGLLQGGESGPVIVPGEPGVSLAVIWPQRADHPGKFSPAELAAVRAWIEAGAP